MQTVRQVILDAPEFVPIPLEFQHHAIELTIKPLADAVLASVSEEPVFLIADVDHIEMPSREERNARR
ncbi:hypothetical protein JCM14076_20300 [Methylosoma difficile]